MHVSITRVLCIRHLGSLVLYTSYTSNVLADTSTEISADSRSICRPSLGRYTSVNKSTDISWSTYQLSVDRYVDLHSTDMLTDTSVESRSICRPIYRSRGAQNTHDLKC